MMEVAAAILERNGRLLIGQRALEGSCAGLWEFIGGKREEGETLPETLVRECREELGGEVSVGKPCAVICQRYPDREVRISFFHAIWNGGEPQVRVHNELRWVEPQELLKLSFCPADQELLPMLAATYGVSPGRYRHFKGTEYQVLALARHSETLEPMVVYRPLYGEGGVWVRPAIMFSNMIAKDGKMIPRFVKIAEN